MICLRCGYCCVHFSVVLPDGSYKPSGEECKFLIRKYGMAICKIYGKDWSINDNGTIIKGTWEETPCGQFTQIEKTNLDLCRLGSYTLQEKRKKQVKGEKT